MNTPAYPSTKTVHAIAHSVVQNQGRHSRYTIDLAFALIAALERVKALEAEATRVQALREELCRR